MTQKITPQELQKILQNKTDQKIICIDVRTEGEYDAQKIAGTVNMPIDHLRNHMGELKKYDTVYVVCASGSRSQLACDQLGTFGIKNVIGLNGGITAWQNMDLPVVGSSTNRIPLMRQVLIAAGSLVLTGCVLGFIVNQLFFFIAAAVSIGLLYAGFSGHCLMMKILVKMPWNQSRG